MRVQARIADNEGLLVVYGYCSLLTTQTIFAWGGMHHRLKNVPPSMRVWVVCVTLTVNETF